MSDRFFGLRTVLEIPNPINSSVFIIASQRPFYGTAVLLERTPHQCVIGSFGSMIEELFGEMGFGFGCLRDEKQTRGVLIDAMDETYRGIIHVEFLAEIVRERVQ